MAWLLDRARGRSDDGLDEYGKSFVGDPLRQLRDELLDGLFYLHQIENFAEQNLWSKPLTLSYLTNACYNNAVERGFHDKPRSFGDDMALIHSEVSEALEEFRASGSPSDETVAAELADVIIRVCDTAGKFGVDLDLAVKKKMEVNRSRPYRHGGKHL